MDRKGYVRTERNYEALKLHRLIARNPQHKVIDHINHYPADNRKENLRIVTQRENAANQQIQKRRKTSRYKGVFYRESTRKWIASIKVNQKHKHIGCFNSEEEAARAYNEKALFYFGEYAYLNKVQEAVKFVQPKLVER